MKKLYLICITLFCMVLFAGCTTGLNVNSIKETWLCEIKLNPEQWTCGTDPWFLTGKSELNTSCSTRGMTLTSVKVPNFTNLVIDGHFKVQIDGSLGRNSVKIEGPNSALRMIAVDVTDHSVIIHQVLNCDKRSKYFYERALKQVIVRVGAKSLCKLTNKGSGNIYGRDITSEKLTIESFGCGNITLAGRINLYRVNQNGQGVITVLGVCAPSTFVKVNGDGKINLSGRIGVQSIENIGKGKINILGADSDCLRIYACGCNKTIVVGSVNLKHVNIADKSRVYVYGVNSNGLTVELAGETHLGLAGVTKSLILDTKDYSCFQGQHLHACDAYVHTYGSSHANVTVDKKLFADADGNSSIFIFGTPAELAKFTGPRANIISVFSNTACAYPCKVPPS